MQRDKQIEALQPMTLANEWGGEKYCFAAVYTKKYQQRREGSYIMNFKKIVLKVTTVTAVTAMMLSTVAFAAEPTDDNIVPCGANKVWALSPYRTNDYCWDATQSTISSARSNCETFSGSTTVDGISSRVRVYYRKGSSTGTKISGNAYFTATGTKTNTLTSSVGSGILVYGIYDLQYGGPATTATGRQLNP